MSGRPARVMLDTNVLVDSYCRWHKQGASARMIVGAHDPGCIELYYPVHVLKDVLFILMQEFKREARKIEGELTESTAAAARETAIACMRNIMELATPVGADGSDLWLADTYLPIHHDFEDNLVLAACKRIRADYLVTNDQQLARNANVLAKTPAQMVELMKLGRLQTFGDIAPDEVSWEFRR